MPEMRMIKNDHAREKLTKLFQENFCFIIKNVLVILV
jgi:hypothetical protein